MPRRFGLDLLLWPDITPRQRQVGQEIVSHGISEMPAFDAVVT
jgi:hypothetical protein